MIRKLCVCAALFIPAAGFAKAKSLHDQMTGQGYGMAGCGLGSIAFGDKEGATQIFAATTNGTFGTQTFGISSGTSNCEEGGGSSKSAFRAKLNPYVVANQAHLQNDISKGSGESIRTLEAMGGCEAGQLGPQMQQQFQSIFSDSNNDRVSEKIYDIVSSNPKCNV